MESSSFTNSDNYLSLQHRRYQKTQRLIPLTKEIEMAMVNFNGSESATSISDKLIFNTMSIMSLVRDEVYTILQKLSISDQVCRKEIDDIIKKSLEDCDTKLRRVIIHDTSNELEITVKDITDDQDKTTHFMENIENLEHRISKLEKRTRFLIKNVPKLRLLQAKKFKINISAIKNKLNSINQTNSRIKREPLNNENDKNEELSHNIYDDFFYTMREYTLNILNYKKSLQSFEFNQNSKFNPSVKPTHNVLLSQGENVKKLSMFLTS